MTAFENGLHGQLHQFLPKGAKWHWNSWTFGSLILAGLALTPVASVVFLALHPSGGIWRHLLDTSLPVYIKNTLALMGGVGICVLVTGLATAWLVTMCKFPGRKLFEWFLLFPLAIPAYVMAYAYTDLLEYSGPVQASLRDFFGWQNGNDYWFPEIRSLGGAIVLMGLVLYPYVYLLARSAFLEQSVNTLEVSRVLGRGPWRTFFTVSVPGARPAISVGLALALMETLNDYGTVDFFAVPTMTAGIIDVWLGMGSLAGGSQIAALMLLFVVLLITLERFSRRRRRYYQQTTSRFLPLPSYSLTGTRALLAIVVCGVPVLAGFILPLIVLARLSVQFFPRSWTPHFQELAINSLWLSGVAAVTAVAVALFINYSRRLQGGPLLVFATRIASLGYAVPGAVLAVGIIIPFAAFDNLLDAFLLHQFGISSGLLLSGTVIAVLFAYIVRFLTVAVGQIESSLDKVSPSVDMAARTLGYRAGETMIHYHMPLIRGGMFTALIVVFVDCMKELPATLILRPFGFETLATHVYHYASDEMLGDAALGSLTIVVVGVLPVLFLSRFISTSRSTYERVYESERPR
jgi:iron(III) transport system permease protein